MLNDGYAEHIVKAKTPASVTCGMAAGIVLMIAGLGAAMFVQGFGSIGFLVAIAGAVVFGIFVSRRETEYEYIMVNRI